jgi:hypothetical protein
MFDQKIHASHREWDEISDRRSSMLKFRLCTPSANCSAAIVCFRDSCNRASPAVEGCFNPFRAAGGLWDRCVTSMFRMKKVEFRGFAQRLILYHQRKENARRRTQTFGVHPHLKHLNPGDAITVLPSILRLARRVTRPPHFGHDGIKAAGISLPVSCQRSLTRCSLRWCHECRSRILGCAPALGRTATSSPRIRSFMAECSTVLLFISRREGEPDKMR